jgi:hypothetical protein
MKQKDEDKEPSADTASLLNRCLETRPRAA